jgi:hypothetical protein
MPAPDRRPLHERVLSRIIKDDKTGCWNWQGSKAGPMGYGQIQRSLTTTGGARLNVYTHRVMYEAYREPIPPGMTIDHLCRNVLCCNPDHLEVVTLKENVLRGTSLSAQNKRKTHCKRGHELAGHNLIINIRGERQCRVCHNWRSNESRIRTMYASEVVS